MVKSLERRSSLKPRSSVDLTEVGITELQRQVGMSQKRVAGQANFKLEGDVSFSLQWAGGPSGNETIVDCEVTLASGTDLYLYPRTSKQNDAGKPCRERNLTRVHITQAHIVGPEGHELRDLVIDFTNGGTAKVLPENRVGSSHTLLHVLRL